MVTLTDTLLTLPRNTKGTTHELPTKGAVAVAVTSVPVAVVGVTVGVIVTSPSAIPRAVRIAVPAAIPLADVWLGPVAVRAASNAADKSR